MSSRTSRSASVVNLPSTEPRASLTKRMALFAFMLLLMFYVASAFVSSRDNHRLLKEQATAQQQTSATLDRTLRDLQEARQAINSLVRVAEVQNEEIKRLGGKPVDVIGAFSSPSPTPKPAGSPSAHRSPTPRSSASSRPSARPTASRTPSPRPSPTPSPTRSPIVCITGICIPPLALSAAAYSMPQVEGDATGDRPLWDPKRVSVVVALLIALLVIVLITAGRF